METAVQLYTFDASPLSLTAQLEAVAEAGFDGVETVVVPDLERKRLQKGTIRGGVAVDLGEGDVDLDGCLAAAADVEWVVFEYDLPPEALVSLQAAGDWLATKNHY